MIVINVPQLEIERDFIVISADIEINEGIEKLWYKFPVAFKQYLVTENLDAFLVGLLFLALKTGNDIELKAPISARLNYTLKHYLIPALCLANPKFKEIKIIANELNTTNLNTENVAGTGLSCGVDSFATYYDHINEIDSFKIKYFTFFNAGSHGDLGGEKTRSIFKQRFNAINQFAIGEGIETIPIDTNLNEILKLNFQQSHSFRSISCILHLQKLFKNYYYASAYRIDHFKLNAKDTSDSDIFNLKMLSTESISFFSSVSQFSRVERTLMISKHPKTYTFLDVCTNPSINKRHINCSICYKCLRTQLTLDIDGELHNYKQVFDIEKFKRIKLKYISSLLVKKNKTILDYELINHLKENNYSPPLKIYYYATQTYLKFLGKRIKKYLHH